MKRSFTALFFIALTTVFTVISSFGQETVTAQQVANSKEATSTVRVGVTLPKTQFAEGVDNVQMAAGLRELVGQYFKGTTVEVVALDAKLPELIGEEAKEKKCAYILQVAVAQKKGGSGAMGVFKKVAPVLVAVVPMAGMAGAAGAIAGSVAQSAIYSTANMASATKSKDQFIFEYSLTSAGDGAVKAGESLKVKAKSDGEDILSPLVEKMAEKVVATAK